MNCDRVRKTLSGFPDRAVSDDISQHLAHCRDCSNHAQELSELYSALHELPQMAPPARLITQLQVLASRERVRRLSHSTLTALMRFWGADVRLFFDNLMRPLAIPFAGGLVSALVLFSMLSPALQFPRLTTNDVPSGLFTQSVATLEGVPPFGFSEDNVVVQLTLNDQGAVIDCQTPNNVDPKVRNDIANMILFTEFRPATEFGVPTAGKILVSFRRIIVRG